jgi:hypothetical protein
MPIADPLPGAPERPSPAVRPDVIVDFDVARGMLAITLHNIGGAAAYDVRTTFNRPFRGAGGRQDISGLMMFQSMPFLAPGKRLTHQVDALHGYLLRDEPTALTATIAFADRDGNRYENVVPHDLRVYRELAELAPD